MPYLIPRSAFEQEIDEAELMLAQFGSVTTLVDEASDARISFRVEAPGYGLPTSAIFEFREWYHPVREGWLRQRYAYEYRPTSGRRAHHMGHAGLARPHQHCEPPGRRSNAHYDDHERLLRPTAEELGALYAHGRPIDCRDLRPIAPLRAPRRHRASGSLKGRRRK